MSYPPFHPSAKGALPLVMSKDEFFRAFRGESGFVEFKRGIGRPVAESIVAFSNADGGVILIGVDDDGQILGREFTQGVQDDLHQLLNTVREPGRYGFHQLVVDGVSLVIVSVARRRDGFCQTSEGRVLVRQGTRDQALFGEALRRFLNERSLGRFEQSPAGALLADVAPARLEILSHAFGWSSRDSSIDRLVERGLVVADGEVSELTVAGALVLLDRPDESLGKAYVEVLRFGDSSTRYDRRVEIFGSVDDQVAAATKVVFEELGAEMVVLGLRRHQLPRIPEVVLREAIANAVAHRSYELDGSAVRIEIRPDAVVVVSPGGFPEPVTEDNIRETQAPRNLDVIRVLRQLGLAEDAGRGIDVMEDSMREEMLDPPTFKDRGHSVVVTLPIRSPVAPAERAWVQEIQRRGQIEPTDRILLVHAARGEVLTNGRVRELLGVDSREARAALRRLRDQGFLLQEGERGGATYIIDGSLAPPAGLRLSRAELADMIVELASEMPVSNADVRERTGLDRGEALRLLDHLVGSGRLRRTGERRGTRYVLEPPDSR